MNFLIVFIALSIVNVIFSTVRSIVTVKGGKVTASLLNGGYFAFYNIMLLYTVMEFPMWQKCIITFVCNVLGVYIVKLIEQKFQKDKLWKIEATFKSSLKPYIEAELNKVCIPYNYIENIGEYCIFNIYCSSKQQSAEAKKIIRDFGGKYFASESKIL